MTIPRVSLAPVTAEAIAKYLERGAHELEISHYSPRHGQVTPRDIREEIDRVRRWAALLRATP